MCLRGSLPSKHLSLGIGAVVILQFLFTYAPHYSSSSKLQPFHSGFGLGSCSAASCSFRRSGEADHLANAFIGRLICLRPSPLTLNGIGQNASAEALPAQASCKEEAISLLATPSIGPRV